MILFYEIIVSYVSKANKAEDEQPSLGWLR